MVTATLLGSLNHGERLIILENGGASVISQLVIDGRVIHWYKHSLDLDD